MRSEPNKIDPKNTLLYVVFIDFYWRFQPPVSFFSYYLSSLIIFLLLLSFFSYYFSSLIIVLLLLLFFSYYCSSLIIVLLLLLFFFFLLLLFFFFFLLFFQGRQTSWRMRPICTCELKNGFRGQWEYSSDRRYFTIISFFLDTSRNSPVICFCG